MEPYPMERRESVVRRVINEEISISALVKETGIAQWTLYRRRGSENPNGRSGEQTRETR